MLDKVYLNNAIINRLILQVYFKNRAKYIPDKHLALDFLKIRELFHFIDYKEK